MTNSGNPGYFSGNNLLIAYNVTINNTINRQLEREGLYMVGRSNDGICIDGDGYPLTSYYDTLIKFHISSDYSCKKDLTLSKFKTFCEDKIWKKFQLFNFPTRLQYVGKFGNSRLDYTDVFYINKGLG
jgi:hypothetical protein